MLSMLRSYYLLMIVYCVFDFESRLTQRFHFFFFLLSTKFSYLKSIPHSSLNIVSYHIKIFPNMINNSQNLLFIQFTWCKWFTLFWEIDENPFQFSLSRYRSLVYRFNRARWKGNVFCHCWTVVIIVFNAIAIATAGCYTILNHINDRHVCVDCVRLSKAISINNWVAVKALHDCTSNT